MYEEKAGHHRATVSSSAPALAEESTRADEEGLACRSCGVALWQEPEDSKRVEEDGLACRSGGGKFWRKPRGSAACGGSRGLMCGKRQREE